MSGRRTTQKTCGCGAAFLATDYRTTMCFDCREDAHRKRCRDRARRVAMANKKGGGVPRLG